MDSDAVTNLLIEIKVKLDLLINQKDDHEQRIRALEKSKWVLVGAAGALGGVAGKLVSLL